MKLAFIGGGAMGFALARAALARKLIGPQELLVIDRDEKQCQRAKAELGALTALTVDASLREYDLVVLAVKPQDAFSACHPLQGLLQERQLLISIMAGITREQLKNLLSGHAKIVRAMPNLPAQVSCGMTVFCPSSELTPEDLQNSENLFSAVGAALRVDDEALLDAATAVSGSGPGYVFYFVEHMITAAQRLGFSPAEAQLLVSQTLRGALELWRSSGKTPAELRGMVTSKGGTTYAALEVFASGRLGEVLEQGILRATERSRELSAGKK